MTDKRKRLARVGPATDDAIHHDITAAILDGRLKAGTRLAEHRLAAIFGVSRERIRKILHRLGAERRLEIIPNRGARVPRPSPDEIRSIYEAHRVLEAGVLQQLMRHLSASVIERLDRHHAEERAAVARGDRETFVRLSGQFHMLLVDALGNPELSRFLRDLLSRSSIMVSVYEPAHQSICAADEHGDIIEALRAGDLARALDLSRHHFQHVEERVSHGAGEDAPPDLEAIFGREPAPAAEET
jgi:DNA-binding GntR family transcriptional regulator